MASRYGLKFLSPDGRGTYSNFEWPLPRDGKPGKWVTAKGKLVACKNGIHACTLNQAPRWLNARAYVIELDGRIIDAGNKLVARRGRLVRHLDKWGDTSARLFAADCAERVLPIFEREFPDDDRPRKAIEVVRALARGEIADADRAAGAAAAYAAAEAAYGAAVAEAAAHAADSPDAERTWQANRLAHYLGLTATEKEAVL